MREQAGAVSLYSLVDSASMRIVVRDIDVKFIFERKKNVDSIQRVDAKLLKSALLSDLVLGDVLCCSYHRDHSLAQIVGHIMSLTLSKWYPLPINSGTSFSTARSVTLMSGRGSMMRPSCRQKIAPFLAWWSRQETTC